MMKKYIPYGPEWEKQIMKLTKKDIIKMLREVCIERNVLQDNLYDSINGYMGNITAGKL